MIREIDLSEISQGSSVSNHSSSVSKIHILYVVRKTAQILAAQGVSCCECPLTQYKLSPLSDACGKVYIHHTRDVSISRMGLTILCGDDRLVATFELTLSPCRENSMRRKD